MDLSNVEDELLIKEVDKRGYDTLVNKVLTKLTGKDDYEHSYKQMLKVFITAVFIFSAVIILGVVIFVSTTYDMKKTYIQETDKILMMNSKIESASAWEQLPDSQKKEKLRNQFFTIIEYYSEKDHKLTSDQMMQTFESLWLSSQSLKNVNFFMPLAYMKVATNFDPNYQNKSKLGIAGMYLVDYEKFSKYSDTPFFNTSYMGKSTALNPSESTKLLVAKMDYLMKLFSGRIDWVFFALFNNEYEVIDKYWDDGNGEIPDEAYKSGPLSEALNYYHSFENWKIPVVKEK